MCSAMGQQALVVEAIQAGAKDFVVKPFQPSRVLEAVAAGPELTRGGAASRVGRPSPRRPRIRVPGRP